MTGLPWSGAAPTTPIVMDPGMRCSTSCSVTPELLFPNTTILASMRSVTCPIVGLMMHGWVIALAMRPSRAHRWPRNRDRGRWPLSPCGRAAEPGSLSSPCECDNVGQWADGFCRHPRDPLGPMSHHIRTTLPERHRVEVGESPCQFLRGPLRRRATQRRRAIRIGEQEAHVDRCF